MLEVVLGRLLNIRWVTLGHTTLIAIHHKFNPLFRVGTSYLVDGFLAKKLIGSPVQVNQDIFKHKNSLNLVRK